tara:strand:+ start:566 stop:907 length:342 start_codon:yes stop_codon:yes gene_type:complete
MAVKRAKKLSKQEYDNVKIIEKRHGLIIEQKTKIGLYRAESVKKSLAVTLSGSDSKKELEEIGNIELYINKLSISLESFTIETEQQNVALAANLKSKYGEGYINPTKGTFVPK